MLLSARPGRPRTRHLTQRASLPTVLAARGAIVMVSTPLGTAGRSERPDILVILSALGLVHARRVSPTVEILFQPAPAHQATTTA